ncbi:MAG: hypothetical protein Q8O56_16980 [Solirubrobacteraceae bacterium]|nr:hypothetical protein [Solirubrobacteraceae bacterium]
MRKADAQRGRITVGQLLELGVDRDRIKRWAADGRLRREHTGVYTLGHRDPSPEGVYLSAVLAAGSGARVSHRAAVYLLGGRTGTAPRPEVTVPTTTHRRRPGIVIHRVRALPELDVAALDGIPITTLPRALLDIAPSTSARQLARACHEAWVRHEMTGQQVEACIARNPHKPGAAKLRRALGSDVTLSFLEDAFVDLLDAHALPRPRTNVDRHGDKVDCHWRELGLTVELLSYRFHASRQAFEQDIARRRRSNHLAYTYGDVVERGARTAAELATHLASGRPAAITAITPPRRTPPARGR